MCVTKGVPVRAPTLYRALRCFSLGGFALLSRELEQGAELPFAFEEHRLPGRPPLYEYRPLVSSFVEARVPQLRRLDDTEIALEELRREPAASIFARAHTDAPVTGDDALFRSILLPLLEKAAEHCGGFDWDDAAFDHAHAELEQSLFGERRSYAALAPLVGLTLATPVDLGAGLRVRQTAAGEFAAHWPEASRLLPTHYGREPDRICVIEFEQGLAAGTTDVPDAPGEIADAVTAIRLATAGAVAAGPVLFERLDWRPLGVRPVLPIAAASPLGEPTRLDPFRGSLAADLRASLTLADNDHQLGDALERWELSLFQGEPSRSEQLRASLDTLLGAGDGLWAAALRAALLLGESGRERAALLTSLRGLAHRALPDADAVDAIRRALVEALLHGDRRRLVSSLDEALLGVRPRPTRTVAASARAV
jgi:hypothetical protein